jgi:hypothetical protein
MWWLSWEVIQKEVSFETTAEFVMRRLSTADSTDIRNAAYSKLSTLTLFPSHPWAKKNHQPIFV